MGLVRPFDSKTVLGLTDGILNVTLSDVHAPKRVVRRSTVVPAGKSKLLILDDRVVPGPGAGPLYLRMTSSVEGVHVWPIDGPVPEVGPDMRSFGWLFDWTLPSFEHDHGALSDVAVDHLAVGSQAFHGGVLPCFQDFKQDIAAPGPNHGVFFRSKAGPAFDVRAYDGNSRSVSDFSCLGSNETRTNMLLLGPGNYMDLGVATDGLCFTVLAYAEDDLSMNYPALGFYCYPFVDGLLDFSLIPTTTPVGDEVWSVGDRNLCKKNIAGALTTGWSTDLSPTDGPGFYGVILPPTPGTIVAGLQSVVHKKVNLAPSPSGPACPVEGDPTWRRITMISLLWNALSAGATNAHIVNVFFGPPPGKWYELGPFGYTTAQNLWSTASLPSLGIQNPTGLDATVHVEWGTSK